MYYFKFKQIEKRNTQFKIIMKIIVLKQLFTYYNTNTMHDYLVQRFFFLICYVIIFGIGEFQYLLLDTRNQNGSI